MRSAVISLVYTEVWGEDATAKCLNAFDVSDNISCYGKSCVRRKCFYFTFSWGAEIARSDNTSLDQREAGVRAEY